jgi:hypothetical protein
VGKAIAQSSSDQLIVVGSRDLEQTVEDSSVSPALASTSRGLKRAGEQGCFNVLHDHRR